jgi:hypothetical protein
MRTLLAISLLAIASLACGTLAEMPLQATQNAPAEFISTTGQTVLPTKTPHLLIIVGNDTTWNIREGASLEFSVIGIARGGQEFVKLSVYRGWVETDEGWICGQAFGGSERCE